jgi:ABC-type nitrate/sulfonate/bicarbonate transport system permease component
VTPSANQAAQASPRWRPGSALGPGDRLRALLRHPRTARIVSLVAFLTGWQLVVPLLPTVLIPAPAEVAEFMWAELRGDTLAPTTVYETFSISLQRLGVGFTVALAVGVPVGLAMGLSRAVNAALHDFVVVGLAIPSLLWALVTAMWFGLGYLSPVITVFLAAVPFVVINVAEGVRDVPRPLLDAARSYQVPRARVIRHLVLPSLAPFFFASLRYGVANGWKGLVLAEVYGSVDGAGWMIRYWYDAHRAQGVIGYALFFLLFALLLERVVFGRLSGWVFRWRDDRQDRRQGAKQTELEEASRGAHQS